MNKLFSLLAVFRKGRAVSDPATWKNTQRATNAVAALIISVAGGLAAFGIDIPMDDASALAIAGGIVAVVFLFNAAATAATNPNVGLPASRQTPHRAEVPSERHEPAGPPDRPQDGEQEP